MEHTCLALLFTMWWIFRLKNGSLSSRTKPAILRSRKRKQSENEDDRQVKHPRVDPSDMVSWLLLFWRSLLIAGQIVRIPGRIMMPPDLRFFYIMLCFTLTARAPWRCHLQSQRWQREIIILWGSHPRNMVKVCVICLVLTVITCAMCVTSLNETAIDMIIFLLLFFSSMLSRGVDVRRAHVLY